MLKTEVQVMHQHLRRLDPNAPHVYGHFTSQLNQQSQGQQNGGGAGIALPPLNAASSTAPSGSAPSSFNSGGAAPPAAMQGVEYGFGR